MATIARSAVTASGEAQKTRLVGSRNKKSGLGVFPQIPAQSPSAPQFETLELSKTGTLYSYTIIHPNPKTGKAPFVLGYIDFPEQVRVFGLVELPNGAAPRIGMELATFRRSEDDASEQSIQPYFFAPAKEINA